MNQANSKSEQRAALYRRLSRLQTWDEADAVSAIDRTRRERCDCFRLLQAEEIAQLLAVEEAIATVPSELREAFTALVWEQMRLRVCMPARSVEAAIDGAPSRPTMQETAFSTANVGAFHRMLSLYRARIWEHIAQYEAAPALIETVYQELYRCLDLLSHLTGLLRATRYVKESVGATPGEDERLTLRLCSLTTAQINLELDLHRTSLCLLEEVLMHALAGEDLSEAGTALYATLRHEDAIMLDMAQ